MATIEAVQGFVKPCGTKFCLNGKPYFFGGTNFWNLHALNDDRGVTGSKAFIKNELETQAKKGVNVIRIFSHSDGRAGWRERHLQPRLGVFDEEALKLLDYTVATAGENGIRLIMCLGNYEPFTGGMQQYVDWVLGQGKDKELFYTNAKVKEAYKAWVKMLVTRKNTVNGRLYKDDPSILAFQALNEPHTRDMYEKSKGLVPGKMVLDWLTEMVAFIRGLGVQQMISSGEEGYKADGDVSAPHNNWINGGYKGVDFRGNIQKSGVDYTQIHAYPDNWGFTPDNYKSWYGPNFIKDRANIAFSYNKPIIVEEYGLALGREGWKGVSRDSVMDYVNKWAQDSGYAGSLIWEVKAGNKQHSQGYVFSYGEDGTNAVTRQYTWAKEKNGGSASGGGGSTTGGGGGGGGSQSEECTDIPPNNTYTCVQQAGWGKCKESWMRGFCLKSCNRCTTGGGGGGGGGGGTCTDVSPDKRYTCQQQGKWGKCSGSWMKGYCQKTCGRC